MGIGMICWRGILGRMCLIFEVVGRDGGRECGFGRVERLMR